MPSKLQQLGHVLEAGFKLAAAYVKDWALAPEKVSDHMGPVYRSGLTANGNAFEVRSAVFETSPGSYQLFQITREMQAFKAVPRSEDHAFSPTGGIPLMEWVNTAQIPLHGNTRIFESMADAIAMRKVYDDEAVTDTGPGMAPRAT